ncbi:uncharacterized protein CDAR_55641 [Caerostris darwini]|uniref:Uncharacterized protein n=1 Tax=Caerostris darwini TaxID=1538125 RepID=A0AAV4W207_9ARAC|nr:uncharacterized protein CDAR_55641 [Caerostris darwini]
MDRTFSSDSPVPVLNRTFSPQASPVAAMDRTFSYDSPDPVLNRTFSPQASPVAAMNRTFSPQTSPVAAMNRTFSPQTSPVAAMNRTFSPQTSPVAAMNRTFSPQTSPVAIINRPYVASGATDSSFNSGSFDDDADIGFKYLSTMSPYIDFDASLEDDVFEEGTYPMVLEFGEDPGYGNYRDLVLNQGYYPGFLPYGADTWDETQGDIRRGWRVSSPRSLYSPSPERRYTYEGPPLTQNPLGTYRRTPSSHRTLSGTDHTFSSGTTAPRSIYSPQGSPAAFINRSFSPDSRHGSPYSSQASPVAFINRSFSPDSRHGSPYSPQASPVVPESRPQIPRRNVFGTVDRSPHTPIASTFSRYGYTNPNAIVLNIPPGDDMSVRTGIQKPATYVEMGMEDGQIGPTIKPRKVFNYYTPPITQSVRRFDRKYGMFTPKSVFQRRHYAIRNLFGNVTPDALSPHDSTYSHRTLSGTDHTFSSGTTAPRSLSSIYSPQGSPAAFIDRSFSPDSRHGSPYSPQSSPVAFINRSFSPDSRHGSPYSSQASPVAFINRSYSPQASAAVFIDRPFSPESEQGSPYSPVMDRTLSTTDDSFSFGSATSYIDQLGSSWSEMNSPMLLYDPDRLDTVFEEGTFPTVLELVRIPGYGCYRKRILNQGYYPGFLPIGAQTWDETQGDIRRGWRMNTPPRLSFSSPESSPPYSDGVVIDGIRYQDHPACDTFESSPPYSGGVVIDGVRYQDHPACDPFEDSQPYSGEGTGLRRVVRLFGSPKRTESLNLNVEVSPRNITQSSNEEVICDIAVGMQEIPDNLYDMTGLNTLDRGSYFPPAHQFPYGNNTPEGPLWTHPFRRHDVIASPDYDLQAVREDLRYIHYGTPPTRSPQREYPATL